MHTVIVRRGEIFLQKWNPTFQRHPELRAETQSLLPYLNCHIELEDTTFEQFFELICVDMKNMEQIFASSLYGWPLEPYLGEMRKGEPKPDKLREVQVYWHCDLEEHKDYGIMQDTGIRPYGQYLSVSPGFHGWGPWSDKFSDDSPNEGGYAIEFTPLNEYKKLPLKLVKDFEIWSMEPGKREPLFKSLMAFTVFDVIDAILHEISWGGDPASRDAKAEDLRLRKNAAQEELDEDNEVTS